ncbi:inner membrane protein YiaA [Oceanospirillum sp. HFRX-1_2]
MNNNSQKPTPAFVNASWIALLIGLSAYLIGLWNSDMQLNEQGYYLSVILFGLFASVSLQKSVRDRLEGIKVTNIYYYICWFSLAAAIMLLVIGLWNASLESSEKGFYAMSFILSIFASVAVQKNVRDLAHYPSDSVSESVENNENDFSNKL